MSRELRLLVDHREDLVAERTRHNNRLRWHLHDIDPTWEPPSRAFTTFKHLDIAAGRLAVVDTVIARIALDLIERIRRLTISISALGMVIVAMSARLGVQGRGGPHGVDDVEDRPAGLCVPCRSATTI